MTLGGKGLILVYVAICVVWFILIKSVEEFNEGRHADAKVGQRILFMQVIKSNLKKVR
jgi:hypothetical protein